MDLERRCSEIEVRLDDSGAGPAISGYAAVFNTRSEDLGGFVEEVKPGAFRKSLRRGDDVRALVEHQGGLLTLARRSSGTLRLREDSKGLKTDFTAPDTSAGRDLVELIRRGDLSQMSFGFKVVSDEWRTENKVEVRTLLEVDLVDVSIVSFPAYPETSVAVRALQGRNRARDLRLRALRLRMEAVRLKYAR